MIVSNAIPKAGGHLLFAYLGACGLRKEPGELYADVDISRVGAMTRRPLGGSTKDIWHGLEVRPPEELVSDPSTDSVVNAHVHDCIDLPGHKVAFIYRHPRDILISDVRFNLVRFDWQNGSEPGVNAVQRMLLSRYTMARAIERCNAFQGWLRKADIAVRFEDFVADPAVTARAISSALGITEVDPLSVMGDRTPWITREYRGTWSGRHSTWSDYWDRSIDKRWRKMCGPDVESLYGY